MTSLRFMTWNIQGGWSADKSWTTLPEQAKLIAKHAPDVVMLQEVWTICTASQIEQIKVLSELTGMPHYAYPPDGDLKESHRIRAGVAILSKYPLTDIAHVQVTPRPTDTAEGPRWALLATARIGADGYRLISSHGPTSPGQYPINYVAFLRNIANQYRPPMWPVLGVDMNMGPTDPVLAPMFNTMDLVGISDHGQIDQIWVGKRVPYKVLASGPISCGGISDHNLAYADIERLPIPAPVRVIAPHCTPALLPIAPRTTAGTTQGSAHATFTATDAGTGATLNGLVKVDSRKLGHGVVTVKTGQGVDLPYRLKVTVDPATRDRETTLTLPTVAVSVAGYRDKEVTLASRAGP
jgi:hypothetical protein